MTATETARALLQEVGAVRPDRFIPERPDAAPGTLHAIPVERRDEFPFTLAILVQSVHEGLARVCPVLVPPAFDHVALEGDRWLPDEESPFRTRPGTGLMQVRWAWSVDVQVTALQPAIRVIELQRLRAEVPPDFLPMSDVQGWEAHWRGLWGA